jgi:hypothetical protein
MALGAGAELRLGARGAAAEQDDVSFLHKVSEECFSLTLSR